MQETKREKKSVGDNRPSERCEQCVFDQWLFYQNSIFKCFKVYAIYDKAEREGKTDEERGGRDENEREVWGFFGILGVPGH